MDCPAPQPQPQPAAGNESWLERLRASRGFPPADGLDLGSFLSLQTADDRPKPRAVSRSTGHRRNETVADIISDLFGMGGGGNNCERFRGKAPRKQQNPSFFNGTEGSNTKKSSNGGCPSDDQKSAEELRVEVEVEIEEDEDIDLRAYSKSEVTVIDSSVQGWKREMYVFRKGKNDWKVREKKGKLRSPMDVRKKRKLPKPNSSDKDDNADEKRRKKQN